jgi:predicted RNase H-like nuclease
MFVGLDGYSKGWVAVWIDRQGDGEIDFYPDIGCLFAKTYDMAMIDIPIGLPASHYRHCDLEGRTMLAQSRARLFTGARRPLLDFTEREAAHAWGRKTDGRGVSCQLFCLLPKIKQVDDQMTPDRQMSTRETHPELVFLRLNKGKALPSKKTEDGIERRSQLLLQNGFSKLDSWMEKRLGKGAKRDDVLDACACAVAAKEANEERRLPKKQQASDSRGLKMEIWF